MLSLGEFDELAQRVSRWGTWGSEDQRGTLNFITPEVIRRATASVLSGEVFELGMDLSWDGVQTDGGVRGRINPVRTMTAINEAFPLAPESPDVARYNDDIVITPIQVATHWDALSHNSHRGVLYNGFPADSVTAVGATRLGIESMGATRGIVSRGVLLDVARHYGHDCLPRKFAITQAVLEEVEAAQGQPVEEGDIVVIRTGLGRHYLERDIPGYRKDVPALEYDALLFLYERNAAAVAIDNMPVELLPANVEAVGMPVHILCLVVMGLPLGENLVLEDLASACAADRRYTFLLEATPERFIGSTGGMVNPVAIR